MTWSNFSFWACFWSPIRSLTIDHRRSNSVQARTKFNRLLAMVDDLISDQKQAHLLLVSFLPLNSTLSDSGKSCFQLCSGCNSCLFKGFLYCKYQGGFLHIFVSFLELKCPSRQMCAIYDLELAAYSYVASRVIQGHLARCKIFALLVVRWACHVFKIWH